LIGIRPWLQASYHDAGDALSGDKEALDNPASLAEKDVSGLGLLKACRWTYWGSVGRRVCSMPVCYLGILIPRRST